MTTPAAAKASAGVKLCVEQGGRVGDNARISLERAGVLYEYGSTRLLMGVSSSLNTSDPTTMRVLNRMANTFYEYPSDMYGGYL